MQGRLSCSFRMRALKEYLLVSVMKMKFLVNCHLGLVVLPLCQQRALCDRLWVEIVFSFKLYDGIYFESRLFIYLRFYFILLYFILCAWVFCLYVCLHTHVASACMNKKRVIEFLGTRVTVSCRCWELDLACQEEHLSTLTFQGCLELAQQHWGWPSFHLVRRLATWQGWSTSAQPLPLRFLVDFRWNWFCISWAQCHT